MSAERQPLPVPGASGGRSPARPAPLADPAVPTQRNGKCERWIRTVLAECLYLEVFSSSGERRVALARFVTWYNEVRPHLGIGGRTPRQRFTEKLAA
jgi:transposase InsO family protein